MLFGWTNCAVFSTSDRRGSLGTDGGWALYFVDKFGVLFFGQYWPMAGWTALVILATLLVTALAWSLRTCERCFCCGGSCCRRGQRASGGVVDPALRHLQLRLSGPKKCWRPARSSNHSSMRNPPFSLVLVLGVEAPSTMTLAIVTLPGNRWKGPLGSRSFKEFAYVGNWKPGALLSPSCLCVVSVGS